MEQNNARQQFKARWTNTRPYVSSFLKSQKYEGKALVEFFLVIIKIITYKKKLNILFLI